MIARHVVGGLISVPIAIGLAIALLSLATAVGLYGLESRADPFLIFASTVVYNLPLLGVLAVGGLLFVVGSTLLLALGWRSVLANAIAIPVAAAPALLYEAILRPEHFSVSKDSVHLPVLFALLLGLFGVAWTVFDERCVQ